MVGEGGGEKRRARLGASFLAPRETRRWWSSAGPEVRFNGGEHLVAYVPVIIGRDNDRVAASCLWRDCRSRRRSLGHVRGWLLRATGSISSSAGTGFRRAQNPASRRDVSLTATATANFRYRAREGT